MNIIKVLFVDDEKSIRKLFSKLLEKNGFSVHTAKNGDKAIEKIKNNYFDFIITDFLMPGELDGLNLIKKIKEISPKTEIISISGWTKNVSENEIKESGALCFLMKPVNIKQLIIIMKKD